MLGNGKAVWSFTCVVTFLLSSSMSWAYWRSASTLSSYSLWGTQKQLVTSTLCLSAEPGNEGAHISLVSFTQRWKNIWRFVSNPGFACRGYRSSPKLLVWNVIYHKYNCLGFKKLLVISGCLAKRPQSFLLGLANHGNTNNLVYQYSDLTCSINDK